MVNPIWVLKNLLDVERELGEFIAGPDQTGLPGHVQGRYRERCDEFANLPPWAKALSGVTGGSISRFCKPWWDGRGFDGPEVNPPLVTGGQCPGVNYNVTIRRRNDLGQETTPIVREFEPAPIEIVFEAPTVNCEGSPPGSVAQPTVIYRSGGANRLAFGNFCGPASALISCVAVRSDGLPDECGDQNPDDPLRPGPNPPPNPGPLPGPEPTDNPDPDNPVPIFPIPPFDDPVYGPQPIVGPSDPGGGDGDGGGGGGFDYGPIGSPGTSVPSSGDDNASGEAPEGFELTGLKVDFVVIPPKANQFKEGVYRGVCYAYLGTVEGLDLDPAGATMRSGQFIFAERPRLTRWEVSANSGWSILVTPYYRPLEMTS